MDYKLNQIQVFYEIVMAIGRSLDLNTMLKEALSVILRKLNCSAGGVFYTSSSGHPGNKIHSMVLPKIFVGNPGFTAISDEIESEMNWESGSADQGRVYPRTLSEGNSYTLIMILPEIGFIFLRRTGVEFEENLIRSLEDPMSRLASACIACFQNDELIKSRFSLELRVSMRTNELEKRNEELNQAYSELKAAQKQLIQNEKLVSIGQLAAGVAHEINNPTGFITSNLQTMKEYLKSYHLFFDQQEKMIEDARLLEIPEILSLITRYETFKKEFDFPFLLDDGEELISESIDGAERIKEIVLGLRNFSRSDDSSFKLANVNLAIEDAIRLTWNELKYKCELKKNLNTVPPILCRLDQLTQVFVNIFVNAAQAIEGHGSILVESWYEDAMVIVKICDDGTGITEQNKEKLFDPFFTTKEVGAGTGLGLSISHGIVAKHKGTIQVESTLGQGACFRLIFPAGREFEIKD